MRAFCLLIFLGSAFACSCSNDDTKDNEWSPPKPEKEAPILIAPEPTGDLIRSAPSDFGQGCVKEEIRTADQDGSVICAPDNAVVTTCRNRLVLKKDEEALHLPFCGNHAVDESHKTAWRVVIMQHGLLRNPTGSIRAPLRAARDSEFSVSHRDTIFFAPQFLLEEDLGPADVEPNLLFWDTQWNTGDDSHTTDAHPRPKALSSFEVYDRILKIFSDKSLYPKLKVIVLMGHSAGGQMVQRYAPMSQAHQEIVDSGLWIRYIVANPSSYMYLDERRPTSGNIEELSTPSETEIDACSSYNEYKYGLEDLDNAYAQAVGAEQIRDRYHLREIYYLLGEADNDTDDEMLAKSCPAKLQGPERLTRAKGFWNHLKSIYGSVGKSYRKFAIIPGAAHSTYDLLNSPCGGNFLYHLDLADCQLESIE